MFSQIQQNKEMFILKGSLGAALQFCHVFFLQDRVVHTGKFQLGDKMFH